MGINRSESSEIQLLHLNTNMGVRGVRDKIKDSVYGTLSFFMSRTPDSIYEHSDIASTVDPVIAKGGDVLGFSEVFGHRQLDYIVSSLESRGYKTYFTEAFQMWSQEEAGEHLYNVIGVKSPYSRCSSLKNITKLQNNRKVEGKLISLLYMLRSDVNDIGSEITKALSLNNRLVNGILDGAIMNLDLGDSLDLSHLHVHSDNPNLNSFFNESTNTANPHIMLGDFNIGNIYDFLSKPPFSGKDYKSLLPDGAMTFPYSKGLVSAGKFLHNTPDNIIGNSLIENIHTTSFKSISDHDGIISRIKIK